MMMTAMQVQKEKKLGLKHANTIFHLYFNNCQMSCRLNWTALGDWLTGNESTHLETKLRLADWKPFFIMRERERDFLLVQLPVTLAQNHWLAARRHFAIFFCLPTTLYIYLANATWSFVYKFTQDSVALPNVFYLK